MASLGHVAVGMAAARWERSRARPLSESLLASMLLYAGLSLSPDLDVIGFRYGVTYFSEWGHRGASHSLFMALLVGVWFAALMRVRARPFVRTALLATAVVASHGLLDSLTDGGFGAALLWPFSQERIWAPISPLPVAPIGRNILSAHGLYVMGVESVMFAPLFAYALWPRARPPRV